MSDTFSPNPYESLMEADQEVNTSKALNTQLGLQGDQEINLIGAPNTAKLALTNPKFAQNPEVLAAAAEHERKMAQKPKEETGFLQDISNAAEGGFALGMATVYSNSARSQQLAASGKVSDLYVGDRDELVGGSAFDGYADEQPDVVADLLDADTAFNKRVKEELNAKALKDWTKVSNILKDSAQAQMTPDYLLRASQAAEGKDFLEATAAFFGTLGVVDSFKTLSYVTVQSLAMMAPALGASIPLGPMGMPLVMGAHSRNMELMSGLNDLARENSVDVQDPQAMASFFAKIVDESDPSLLAKWDSIQKRAGVVGAMDGVAGILAPWAMPGLLTVGRDLRKTVQTVRQVKNARKTEKGLDDVWTKAGKLAEEANPNLAKPMSAVAGNIDTMSAQMVTQGFLGGLGEAGGALAAGEKINWADVWLEALGEFTSAPVEVVTSTLAIQRAEQTKAQMAESAQIMKDYLDGEQKAAVAIANALGDQQTVEEWATAIGGDETLYLDPTYIDQVENTQGEKAQESVLANLQIASPALAQRVTKAKAEGVSVRITKGELLALNATPVGQPVAASLTSHIRATPNSFTVAEAIEFKKNGAQKAIEKLRQAAVKNPQDAELLRQSRDLVRPIIAKLSKHPNFTTEQAQAATEVWANWIAQRAKLLGISAQEAMDMMQLGIAFKGENEANVERIGTSQSAREAILKRGFTALASDKTQTAPSVETPAEGSQMPSSANEQTVPTNGTGVAVPTAQRISTRRIESATGKKEARNPYYFPTYTPISDVFKYHRKPDANTVTKYMARMVSGLEVIPGFKAKLDEAVALIPDADEFAKNQVRINTAINLMKGNLRAVINLTDPTIRKRLAMWYDGAHKIAVKFANDYGISTAQSSALIARLSPQRSWFVNLTLAQRIADIHFSALRNRTVDPTEFANWFNTKVAPTEIRRTNSVRNIVDMGRSIAQGIYKIRNLEADLANARTIKKKYNEIIAKARSKRNQGEKHFIAFVDLARSLGIKDGSIKTFYQEAIKVSAELRKFDTTTDGNGNLLDYFDRAVANHNLYQEKVAKGEKPKRRNPQMSPANAEKAKKSLFVENNPLVQRISAREGISEAPFASTVYDTLTIEHLDRLSAIWVAASDNIFVDGEGNEVAQNAKLKGRKKPVSERAYVANLVAEYIKTLEDIAPNFAKLAKTYYDSRRALEFKDDILARVANATDYEVPPRHRRVPKADSHYSRGATMTSDASGIPRTYSQLVVEGNYYAAGILARYFMETALPQGFYTYTPEGKSTGMMAKKPTGEPESMMMPPFADLAACVQLLADNRMTNIYDSILSAHKVRNFYNNIYDPTNPNAVTIDTHAVAASIFTPVGASSKYVEDNFSAFKDAYGDVGMFPVYWQAYVDLANEMNYEARVNGSDEQYYPRQIQSIVWEAIRVLFPASRKTAEVNEVVLDILNKESDPEVARAVVLGVIHGNKEAEVKALLDSDADYAKVRDKIVEAVKDVQLPPVVPAWNEIPFDEDFETFVAGDSYDRSGIAIDPAVKGDGEYRARLFIDPNLKIADADLQKWYGNLTADGKTAYIRNAVDAIIPEIAQEEETMISELKVVRSGNSIENEFAFVVDVDLPEKAVAVAQKLGAVLGVDSVTTYSPYPTENATRVGVVEVAVPATFTQKEKQDLVKALKKGLASDVKGIFMSNNVIRVSGGENINATAVTQALASYSSDVAIRESVGYVNMVSCNKVNTNIGATNDSQNPQQRGMGTEVRTYADIDSLKSKADAVFRAERQRMDELGERIERERANIQGKTGSVHDLRNGQSAENQGTQGANGANVSGRTQQAVRAWDGGGLGVFQSSVHERLGDAPTRNEIRADRVSIEENSRYLEAVNSGDMATAEAIVRRRADMIGLPVYDVVKNDAFGNPIPLSKRLDLIYIDPLNQQVIQHQPVEAVKKLWILEGGTVLNEHVVNPYIASPLRTSFAEVAEALTDIAEQAGVAISVDDLARKIWVDVRSAYMRGEVNPVGMGFVNACINSATSVIAREANTTISDIASRFDIEGTLRSALDVTGVKILSDDTVSVRDRNEGIRASLDYSKMIKFGDDTADDVLITYLENADADSGDRELVLNSVKPEIAQLLQEDRNIANKWASVTGFNGDLTTPEGAKALLDSILSNADLIDDLIYNDEDVLRRVGELAVERASKDQSVVYLSNYGTSSNLWAGYKATTEKSPVISGGAATNAVVGITNNWVDGLAGLNAEEKKILLKSIFESACSMEHKVRYLKWDNIGLPVALLMANSFIDRIIASGVSFDSLVGKLEDLATKSAEVKEQVSFKDISPDSIEDVKIALAAIISSDLSRRISENKARMAAPSMFAHAGIEALDTTNTDAYMPDAGVSESLGVSLKDDKDFRLVNDLPFVAYDVGKTGLDRIDDGEFTVDVRGMSEHFSGFSDWLPEDLRRKIGTDHRDLLTAEENSLIWGVQEIVSLASREDYYNKRGLLDTAIKYIERPNPHDDFMSDTEKGLNDHLKLNQWELDKFERIFKGVQYGLQSIKDPSRFSLRSDVNLAAVASLLIKEPPLAAKLKKTSEVIGRLLLNEKDIVSLRKAAEKKFGSVDLGPNPLYKINMSVLQGRGSDFRINTSAKIKVDFGREFIAVDLGAKLGGGQYAGELVTEVEKRLSNRGVNGAVSLGTILTEFNKVMDEMGHISDIRAELHLRGSPYHKVRDNAKLEVSSDRVKILSHVAQAIMLHGDIQAIPESDGTVSVKVHTIDDAYRDKFSRPVRIGSADKILSAIDFADVTLPQGAYTYEDFTGTVDRSDYTYTDLSLLTFLNPEKGTRLLRAWESARGLSAGDLTVWNAETEEANLYKDEAITNAGEAFGDYMAKGPDMAKLTERLFDQAKDSQLKTRLRQNILTMMRVDPEHFAAFREARKEVLANSKDFTPDRLWVHGSTALFTEFSLNKLGEQGIAYGPGIYLTPHVRTSLGYAGEVNLYKADPNRKPHMMVVGTINPDTYMHYYWPLRAHSHEMQVKMEQAYDDAVQTYKDMYIAAFKRGDGYRKLVRKANKAADKHLGKLIDTQDRSAVENREKFINTMLDYLCLKDFEEAFGAPIKYSKLPGYWPGGELVMKIQAAFKGIAKLQGQSTSGHLAHWAAPMVSHMYERGIGGVFYYGRQDGLCAVSYDMENTKIMDYLYQGKDTRLNRFALQNRLDQVSEYTLNNISWQNELDKGVMYGLHVKADEATNVPESTIVNAFQPLANTPFKDGLIQLCDVYGLDLDIETATPVNLYNALANKLYKVRTGASPAIKNPIISVHDCGSSEIAATKIMSAIGINGVSYLGRDGEQCRTLIDDGNIVLRMHLVNNKEASERATGGASESFGGYAVPDAGGFAPDLVGLMRLMDCANLSTFLHESAHLWLGSDTKTAMTLIQKRKSGIPLSDGEERFIRRLGGFLSVAQREGVFKEKNPETNRVEDVFGFEIDANDLDSMIKGIEVWANMNINEQRGMHEYFATSFEVYCRDGHAPTPLLVQIFEALKAFLLDIYKQSPYPPVSADLKGFFDQMFMEESTVANLKQSGITSEENTSAITAMMDADEVDEYNRLVAEADSETRNDLRDMSTARTRKSYEEGDYMIKIAERDYAEDVSKIEQELLKEPHWALYIITTTGFRNAEGVLEPAIKLNTASLIDAGVKPEVVNTLISKGVAERNGELNISEFMEQYPDVAVGDVISNLLPIKSNLDLHAEAVRIKAIELASHADEVIRSNGSLDIAMASISQPQLDALGIQLEAIERMVQRKPRVSGRKSANPTAEIRRAVRASMGNMAVGNLSFEEHLANSRRAGLLCASYMEQYGKATDETQKAFYLAKAMEAKITQITEGQKAVTIKEALRNYQRGVRNISKALMNKNVSMRFKRLMYVLVNNRGLDVIPPIYRENLEQALRRAYGESDALSNSALQGILKDLENQGKPVVGLEEMLDHVKPVSEMTLDEFKKFTDMITQLAHVGIADQQATLISEDKTIKEAVEEAKKQLQIAAEEQGEKRVVNQQTDDGDTFAEKVLNFFYGHIKASTLARVYDREQSNGWFARTFIHTANQCAAMEAEQRRLFNQGILPIVETLFPKGGFSSDPKMLSNGKTYTKGQRVMLALHFGNDHNKARVMAGDPTITEAMIEEVFASFTAEELRAIQGIWDLFEAFIEPMTAKHERVYGVTPSWVTPKSRTVISSDNQTVELTGGHVPIYYVSTPGEKKNVKRGRDLLKNEFNGSFVSSVTNSTYFKDVKDSQNVAQLDSDELPPEVALSFTSIVTGANEILHDLAWGEWLIQAPKLFYSGIGKEIKELYGEEHAKQWDSWFEDIRKGDIVSELPGIMGALQKNVGAAMMGWSLKTAASQLTGIGYVIPRAGAVNFLKGVAQHVAHPRIRSLINEMSVFMRNRAHTQNREIAEVSNRLRKNGKPNFYYRTAYAFCVWAQTLVDNIVWLSAYEKYRRIFSEQDAILAADNDVITTQTDGSIHALSSIERKGEAAYKFFTMFYGWANAALNQTWSAWKAEPNAVLKWTKLLFLGIVMPYVDDAWKALITVDTEGEDDDEEEEKKLNTLIGLSSFTPEVLEKLEEAKTDEQRRKIIENFTNKTYKKWVKNGSEVEDDTAVRVARDVLASSADYHFNYFVFARELASPARNLIKGEPIWDYSGPAGTTFIKHGTDLFQSISSEQHGNTARTLSEAVALNLGLPMVAANRADKAVRSEFEHPEPKTKKEKEQMKKYGSFVGREDGRISRGIAEEVLGESVGRGAKVLQGALFGVNGRVPEWSFLQEMNETNKDEKIRDNRLKKLLRDDKYERDLKQLKQSKKTDN